MSADALRELARRVSRLRQSDSAEHFIGEREEIGLELRLIADTGGSRPTRVGDIPTGTIYPGRGRSVPVVRRTGRVLQAA